MPIAHQTIHDEVRYSHKVCLPHEKLHGVLARAKQSREPVPHRLHSRATEKKVAIIIDMHVAPLAQPEE